MEIKLSNWSLKKKKEKKKNRWTSYQTYSHTAAIPTTKQTKLSFAVAMPPNTEVNYVYTLPLRILHAWYIVAHDVRPAHIFDSSFDTSVNHVCQLCKQSVGCNIAAHSTLY